MITCKVAMYIGSNSTAYIITTTTTIIMIIIIIHFWSVSVPTCRRTNGRVDIILLLFFLLFVVYVCGVCSVVFHLSRKIAFNGAFNRKLNEQFWIAVVVYTRKWRHRSAPIILAIAWVSPDHHHRICTYMYSVYNVISYAIDFNRSALICILFFPLFCMKWPFVKVFNGWTNLNYEFIVSFSWEQWNVITTDQISIDHICYNPYSVLEILANFSFTGSSKGEKKRD